MLSSILYLPFQVLCIISTQHHHCHDTSFMSAQVVFILLFSESTTVTWTYKTNKKFVA